MLLKKHKLTQPQEKIIIIIRGAALSRPELEPPPEQIVYRSAMDWKMLLTKESAKSENPKDSVNTSQNSLLLLIY